MQGAIIIPTRDTQKNVSGYTFHVRRFSTPDSRLGTRAPGLLFFQALHGVGEEVEG